MTESQQIKLNNIIQKIDDLKSQSQTQSHTRTLAEKITFLKDHANLLIMKEAKDNEKDVFNLILERAKSNNTSIPEFLKDLTLQSDTDFYFSKAQKVALMSMHASKGLEFPVVFIAGCEDDLIPYKRLDQGSLKNDCDIDEERRLFYVAMTRAKEHLYFCHAESRNIYGKTTKRRLSPFVSDIEKQLLNHEIICKKRKKKPSQTQLGLFDNN